MLHPSACAKGTAVQYVSVVGRFADPHALGIQSGLVWHRLIADEGFRKDLLQRILETGVAIEDALGSAQDVEGCVEADGTITVVQTRPQM